MTGGEHEGQCGAVEGVRKRLLVSQPADGTSLQTERADHGDRQSIRCLLSTCYAQSTAESTGQAAGNPAVCPHQAGLPEQLQTFL